MKFRILNKICDIKSAVNAPANFHLSVRITANSNITIPLTTLFTPVNLYSFIPPNIPAPTVFRALQTIMMPRNLKEYSN